MDKNETIQYLRAMEQQASQISQCDTRMRSIHSSVDALKRKYASLKLPPRPVYETPNTVSDFATFKAFVAWALCFFIGVVAYYLFEGANDDVDAMTTTMVCLLFISFLPAFIAGKWGNKKRKQEAEAAEAARVREVNQERVSAYDAKKRVIEAQQQKIVEQIRQLNADYPVASQAREQARNKLAELGCVVQLHSDYWSPYALSHIRSLLEHGRADTLKEALNRYEDEESRREHRERVEDYAQAQAAAAEEQAYYSRQQAQYQQEQAEYARQAADYARQQANHAAATRNAVEDMKRQQDWDRIWGN